MPDTLEGFNDLPIATPACGGGGRAVEQNASRCWKSAGDGELRCFATSASVTGLCDQHLREMRTDCALV
jgi:hypothetical protein